MQVPIDKKTRQPTVVETKKQDTAVPDEREATPVTTTVPVVQAVPAAHSGSDVAGGSTAVLRSRAGAAPGTGTGTTTIS